MPIKRVIASDPAAAGERSNPLHEGDCRVATLLAMTTCVSPD